MLVLHQDCLDCEATYWLTSLWLTPEKIWQARTWEGGYAWDIENPGDQPSSDVRVFIGSDGLFGDYFTDYSCAFGVWRQNEDGREELATYCVKTMTPEGGTEPPTVQTVASVFEIDASGSRCRTIRDEPRQVEILQGICERNPSHDLCNSI
jgi:hypothetical protein